ncbi:RNA-binding protein [Hoeflea sp. G2-23]|uniref:RNA-binding protein n=1 Tax=Hoeflea algicola TaxID=2983763 RepID=A0ABT3ZCD8_9HYPH|nr:RNA-binding protein [Hoeflea algicola]MCY0149469.1 RNA-binding protein [Hoeflea algicola]
MGKGVNKVRIEPVNDRMCIVTRERDQPEGLIRFVAGPDGNIVPDLRLVLPGRGCWVTAEREKIDLAIKRKLFGRALKTEVTVDPDLGEMVERLLVDSLLGMMNMARKSGQFITGSGKVEAAVRSGSALALMHATDAADDGVRKLRQANTAQAMGEKEEEIPVFRLFSADELTRAIGDGAFIHAAALAGQAGEGVMKRAKALARYRNDPQAGTD